ncbi:catalase [Corynebacterium sp. YIM 101645]|uniref:Catalase n=1 Tax=Corynebacterium lemuris TaxID=1859292 RepID=A0ABT2FY65_9CORY|nr:catalase [Corynebacterium lemuris]MCS5480182.1 catalase [Corynebacterium lemuris]
MKPEDRLSDDSQPVIPGAPASQPPSLEEPTTPVEPLPPKADQEPIARVTATGCPFMPGAPDHPDPRAQQGEYLTTSTGTRVPETDKSLKAGPRGPVLLQDHHLREKIMHFDHERIPERVVHARGAGAHGVFVANGAAAGISSAGVFQEGRETDVFVRFSTVVGSRGSADTVRDTRGFATKFYTDEGTWDLVANNIPVFFIQDGIKFPDVVHAAKPHPDREIPQAQSAHDTFWDFVSLHTEAQHHVIWQMSDRGIPRSYRMMEGFGIHTFRLVNDAGETTLVKFHWKPRLGVHSLVWEEAQITSGVDPDFHRRDLADSIEAGAYPQWDLGVQVFPDTEEEMFEGIDLLDPTKIVPEELAPVRIIGTMTLNGNPTNFFEQTEQVAFHPGHLPPGIDVTADPLLQGRLFSYLDTQLTRLAGPNFNQIPINRPHAPVNDMFRDGFHQQGNHVGVAPYQPNSLDGGNPTPTTEGARIDVPVPVPATTIGREQPVSFEDHFSQARLFWLSLSAVEQQHTADAYAFELGKCYEENIKARQVELLARIDAGLAATVAAKLGLTATASTDLPDVVPSPALSQVGEEWPLDGRQIGILTTKNTSPEEVGELVMAVDAAGMVPLVVSEHGGKLGELPISRTYDTARSVEFDAVVVAEKSDRPEADILLSEAFRHKKAIALGSGVDTPAVDAGAPGVVGVDKLADALDALTPLMRKHRVWER